MLSFLKKEKSEVTHFCPDATVPNQLEFIQGLDSSDPIRVSYFPLSLLTVKPSARLSFLENIYASITCRFFFNFSELLVGPLAHFECNLFNPHIGN